MQEKVYEIADELRAVACLALNFAQNPYDREHFERVLTLSARLVGVLEQRDPAEVAKQFHDNLLHISPSVGVEAVVVRDQTVLLIRRRDNGLWALPGGLSDVGETAAQTAQRELWEETGLRGQVTRLLGIFDSRLWQSRWKVQLYHIIFQVEVLNGEPQPTTEATEVGFFEADHLPPLSDGHQQRVPLIFKLLSGEMTPPYFDPAPENANPSTPHWQHQSP